MNYLVVQPHRTEGLCVVSIVPEGSEVKLPFESWALTDGKQILFANNRMSAVLKPFYMSGSYQAGAMYAYPYEEMVAIITSCVGPSDSARVRLAEIERDRLAELHANVRREHSKPMNMHKFFAFSAGTADTLLHAVKLCVKFVSIMLLLPFFISWINKDKK